MRRQTDRWCLTGGIYTQEVSLIAMEPEKKRVAPELDEPYFPDEEPHARKPTPYLADVLLQHAALWLALALLLCLPSPSSSPFSFLWRGAGGVAWLALCLAPVAYFSFLSAYHALQHDRFERRRMEAIAAGARLEWRLRELYESRAHDPEFVKLIQEATPGKTARWSEGAGEDYQPHTPSPIQSERYEAVLAAAQSAEGAESGPRPAEY
jgi:hypothetical protein